MESTAPLCLRRSKFWACSHAMVHHPHSSHDPPLRPPPDFSHASLVVPKLCSVQPSADPPVWITLLTVRPGCDKLNVVHSSIEISDPWFAVSCQYPAARPALRRKERQPPSVGQQAALHVNNSQEEQHVGCFHAWPSKMRPMACTCLPRLGDLLARWQAVLARQCARSGMQWFPCIVTNFILEMVPYELWRCRLA